MRAVFDAVRLTGNRDSTAVLTGESGTGKEVMAKLIHHQAIARLSPRCVRRAAANVPAGGRFLTSPSGSRASSV